MKKVIVFSLMSFVLIISAKAQTQSTCNAYGKNKVACQNSGTISKKDDVGEPKKVEKQSEKKDGSTDSPKAQTIRKYNANEFKTKRYFFRSL